MEKVDLFGYMDYREFLKDYCREKKRANPNFSHRVFARKAGFVSPSLLLLVIQGKRNITANSLPRFCRALELNPRQRRHFELLVQFNQSRDSETKRYYYEQLLPRPNGQCGKELSYSQYKYLSEWYCPVIRELISLPEFKEDPKWISQRLKGMITPAEAKKTIKLLFDLGLVVRGHSGRLAQTDSHVTTPADVTHIAAFKFHRQMLELAQRSLLGDKGAEREVSGITTALSKERFTKVKKLVQDFEESLMRELEHPDGEPEGVYQFNFQLFPLTVLKRDGGGHD